jgi:hypothetical protein
MNVMSRLPFSSCLCSDKMSSSLIVPMLIICASLFLPRAFLEERVAEAEASGQGFGESVLYFGCRRSDQDFIHGPLLQRWAQEGRLTLFTAFSREQVGAHSLSRIYPSFVFLPLRLPTPVSSYPCIRVCPFRLFLSLLFPSLTPGTSPCRPSLPTLLPLLSLSLCGCVLSFLSLSIPLLPPPTQLSLPESHSLCVCMSARARASVRSSFPPLLLPGPLFSPCPSVARGRGRVCAHPLSHARVCAYTRLLVFDIAHVHHPGASGVPDPFNTLHNNNYMLPVRRLGVHLGHLKIVR